MTSSDSLVKRNIGREGFIYVARRTRADVYSFGTEPTVSATSAAFQLHASFELKGFSALAVEDFARSSFNSDAGMFAINPQHLDRVDLFYTRSALTVLRACASARGINNAAEFYLGEKSVKKIVNHTRQRVELTLGSKNGEYSLADLFYGREILNRLDSSPLRDYRMRTAFSNYIVRCVKELGQDEVPFLSPGSDDHCVSAAFFAYRIAQSADVVGDLNEIWSQSSRYLSRCWERKSGAFRLTPMDDDCSVIATYFGTSLSQYSEFQAEGVIGGLSADALQTYLDSCRVGGGYAFHERERRGNLFAMLFAVRIMELAKINYSIQVPELYAIVEASYVDGGYRSQNSSQLHRISAFSDDEPYSLKRELDVTVEMKASNDFECRYSEADLQAHGETEHDAIVNLSSLLLDQYEALHALGPETLSANIARRRAALMSVVSREK